MTREEAKKRLEVWQICGECPEDKQCYDSHLHSICEYDAYCDEVSISEAVKVAIKALEKEPCEDCISRKSAILEIQRYGVGCFDADDFTPEQAERFVISRLNGLSPVQPIRPRGKWIETTVRGSKSLVCSKCGADLGSICETNFCPDCGADMRGKSNETDY